MGQTTGFLMKSPGLQSDGAGPGCGLKQSGASSFQDAEAGTDSVNMSTAEAAIAVGIGAVVMLVLQGDDWFSIWMEAGPPGAPACATVCIIAGVSVVALTWLYRLLFCPLELLRGPDDVGYITEGGRTKAQAANDVRRRRKTGDLPPVYPNGWYRVLDSHLLERAEVKSMSILGTVS